MLLDAINDLVALGLGLMGCWFLAEYIKHPGRFDEKGGYKDD